MEISRFFLVVVAAVGAVFYLTRPASASVVDFFSAPDLGVSDNPITGAMEMIQSGVSNLAASVPDALSDPNVLAFLMLVRTGEGTADAAGYSRLFGGAQFHNYTDHPRVRVPFGSTFSTAAGAYQILQGTWDEIAAQQGLQDFSPSSQDLAAVALIKRRGALGDVIAGRFATAIKKCNKEWASLPGSPYGQPTLSLARAGTVLAQQGGTSSEVLA